MPAEKTLIRHTGEKKEARNLYYLHIANVYRLLKWGMLLLFTLYLVCMLLWQRENITYDNLLYLIRDLNISSVSEGGFGAVRYDEQQNMLFGEFQNNLAVAGSSGIRLYDGGGSCVLSDSLAYKNSVLETGDKYMLLYDAGGTEYALFTSLACVMQGKTEHTLQYASVSDSGAYCTVTRSDETKYKITLYNAAFLEIAGYYLDSYVIAAAVHPDGKSVAALTVTPSDWSVQGAVSLFSAFSRETKSVSLGNSFPTAVRYMKNGTLVVICDDCVMYLGENGEELARISLGSSALSFCSISDNKTALVCRENVLGSSSRILVLDSTGKILFDETCSGKVTSVTASSGENAAYIVFGDRVECVSVLGKQSYPYSGHLHALREIAGCPVLCFAAEALPLYDLAEP